MLAIIRLTARGLYTAISGGVSAFEPNRRGSALSAARFVTARRLFFRDCGGSRPARRVAHHDEENPGGGVSWSQVARPEPHTLHARRQHRVC